MMLFSGNANRPLAERVAACLDMPLSKAKVGRFSDGEICIEIGENVRGSDVFVIQPTSAPTNDYLMELLMMVDALHRASASRITAVVPYFGYCRQDRRVHSMRVPISGKVVADMIACVATGRVLTVDLHAEQMQGFFNMPVDNIYASSILIKDIRKCVDSDRVVVSPDVGGVVRARAVAKRLNDADLVIIDKRRPRPNAAEVMNIIGDVEGKTCVIIDDLVDTAGTLCRAAEALVGKGAKQVVAYATHPVLSGKAIANIMSSRLDEVVVTDTIALSEEAMHSKRVRQVSIAEMLAKSIRNIHKESSVSSLFRDQDTTGADRTAS